MGQRLGVIAGSGDFPIHICREARKMGHDCVVAGIKGEAQDVIQEGGGDFQWFDIQEIGDLIAFFKKNRVSEAVFAGKIDHRIIYKNKELRKALPLFLKERDDWAPTSLIKAAIQIFSTQGITIKDPTPYIASAFCEAGIHTDAELTSQTNGDINFGWAIAKEIADLDIGQTVIIKNKAVVAVEGMEGTDEAIKRAGKLAGEGIVVVKVGRSLQDPRIDLPAVGLRTVKSLVQASGHALAFEAKKIPFFQKEEAISLANEYEIALLAK